MCQFFSALVLRNGDILWHEATDSHSDLVAHFQMPDNPACKHFAKVEFTPPEVEGWPMFEDWEKYNLRVDEDTRPDWFDEVENGVVKKLQSVIRSMIVNDERPLILGGARILVSGAKINAIKSSRVISMSGTSRVGSMYGTSSVGYMYDTSRVGSMYGTSSVGYMKHKSTSPKAPNRDEREAAIAKATGGQQ